MCLISFAWKAHPRYPLVVAANRDEFFARPARPVHWWSGEHGRLLAGRDEEAGGTWMAVSARGRFAALTNHRDPGAMRRNAPSRGALVPHFLGRAVGVEESFDELARTAAHFNGFNLLLYDGDCLGVFASRSASGECLAPGVYALSNASLHAPWPKQRVAAAKLSAGLDSLPDREAFFDLLRSDRPAADRELPVTGVGIAWERMLSSAFIRAPGYGTRCSSVAVFDADGGVVFEERSWDEFGRLTGTVCERFSIGA